MQKKLPSINSAHGTETRNIINELIKIFNGMGYTYDEALQKAHDVLSEAQQTNDMNEDVQNQLDNIILENGNSEAEVVQARGGLPLLKDRLDETDSQLAEKANQEVLPIFLADRGVSVNNTAELNTTIIQEVLNEAGATGRPVVFPWTGNASFIEVSGRFTVPSISLSGFGKQTRIRQNSEDVTFDLRNDNAHISDLSITGAGTGRGYHGVWITSNFSSAKRLHIKNLEDGVRVASQDSVTLVSKQPVLGVVVDDIESDLVNFALVVAGSKDMVFNNIRGTYTLISSKSPHLIYFSDGNSTADNINVLGTNCSAYGGSNSTAYQFKKMVGGVVTGLLANDCLGVLNIMESNDFIIRGLTSTNDKHISSLYGSLEIDGLNNNIEVSDVNISSVGDTKSLRIGNDTSNSRIKNAILKTNATTNDMSIVAELRGNTNTFENVETVTNGTGKPEAGIGVWSGDNHKIINPKTQGQRSGVFIRSGDTHEISQYDVDEINNSPVESSDKKIKITSLVNSVVLKPINSRKTNKPDTLLAYEYEAIGDEYDRPNVTNSGHKWIVDFGSWLVANGRVSTASANSLLFLDLGENNIELSSDIKASNREALAVRASSRTNLIAVRLHTALNQLQIAKRIDSNIETVLAEVPFEFQVGRRYTLKVQAYGDRIDAFLDGEKKVSYKMTPEEYTAYSLNTKAGLLSNGGIDGLYNNIEYRKME